MMERPDRALLVTLEDQGPAETTTLAETLEVHPLTVTQRCDDLASDGRIRRVSGGRYGITDDGREYLATLED